MKGAAAATNLLQHLSPHVKLNSIIYLFLILTHAAPYYVPTVPSFYQGHATESDEGSSNWGYDMSILGAEGLRHGP
jgi:hypothetical protein